MEKMVQHMNKDLDAPRQKLRMYKQNIASLKSTQSWAAREAYRFTKLAQDKEVDIQKIQKLIIEGTVELDKKEDTLKVKRLALTKICRKKDQLILNRKSKNLHSVEMSHMMKDI